MEEIKKLKRQILEAQKYANLYQNEFKRQADDYIQALNQQSAQEAERQERELGIQKEELEQIQKKIKEGKIKELLKEIANEGGN